MTLDEILRDVREGKLPFKTRICSIKWGSDHPGYFLEDIDLALDTIKADWKIVYSMPSDTEMLNEAIALLNRYVATKQRVFWDRAAIAEEMRKEK